MTLATQITDAVRQRGSATSQDIISALPQANRGSIDAILAKLVQKGVLRRTATGVYEVAEPIPAEGMQLYADVERLMIQMHVLQLKLMKPSAGRFALRDRVKTDIQEVLAGVDKARSVARTQPQQVQTHLNIAADLLEARARELKDMVARLEREDPKPEPTRGGRGRPAKYR